MRPPDLSDGLCGKFAPEELEKTFWYPGPQDPEKKPTAYAQAAWEQAKEVCIECPIFLRCRAQCWGHEYGVIGGTDQYERHVYRRRMSRLLAKKTEAERADLAAYFHARHARGVGDSPDVMARSTGYSTLSVKLMIAEHQERLDAERPASAAKPRVVRRNDPPEFPEADPPRADGWVWYVGRAHAGHYVAQSADGVYVRMKIKPNASQSTKWFPASVVDLRTQIQPVIQDWKSRPAGAGDSANAMKTHCPRGHAYTEQSTYVTPAGWRVCRTCRTQKRQEAA